MRIALAVMLLFSTPALAHHRVHHRPFHGARYATSGRHRTYRHASSERVERVDTDAGPIRVAARYASRFVGFINALVAAGHMPKEIGCYSPTGHMPHSKHHWGGACDIDQTDRNRTASFMYHVTALAHSFHLTDGCEWRNPDCGHVEVP